MPESEANWVMELAKSGGPAVAIAGLWYLYSRGVNSSVGKLSMAVTTLAEKVGKLAGRVGGRDD